MFGFTITIYEPGFHPMFGRPYSRSIWLIDTDWVGDINGRKYLADIPKEVTEICEKLGAYHDDLYAARDK